MTGASIQCPRCGKTLTAEEIEIGRSLVCPRCADTKEHEQAVEPKGGGNTEED